MTGTSATTSACARYRWQEFVRTWRVPVLGELFMATTTGFSF
jgi:hypothetical protein